MPRLSRHLVTTLSLLLWSFHFPASPPPACAQTTVDPGAPSAALVVKYSDQQEEARCIPVVGDGNEADPEGTSGISFLESSGLRVVTKDFGGELGKGVCKIGEVGTNDCDFDKGFWYYYHGTPTGNWEESPVGGSTYRAHSKDVEGWVWNPAGATQSPPRTKALFARICSASTSPAGQSSGERRPRSDSEYLRWLVVAAAAGALLVLLISVLRRKPDT